MDWYLPFGAVWTMACWFCTCQFLANTLSPFSALVENEEQPTMSDSSIDKLNNPFVIFPVKNWSIRYRFLRRLPAGTHQDSNPRRWSSHRYSRPDRRSLAWSLWYCKFWSHFSKETLLLEPAKILWLRRTKEFFSIQIFYPFSSSWSPSKFSYTRFCLLLPSRPCGQSSGRLVEICKQIIYSFYQFRIISKPKCGIQIDARH